MIYTVNGTVNGERELSFEGDCGFVGDNNASQIVIDLGDFADEEYDYYVVKFNTSSLVCDANEPVFEIAGGEGSLTQIENGVICRMLTDDLTFSGRLQVQIEAHKSSNEQDAVIKTSIAELVFKPSLSSGRANTQKAATLLHMIDKLNRRIDELEIPAPVSNTELATYYKVGGFLRKPLSEIDLDSSGHLELAYGNIDPDMIAALVAIALLKTREDYLFISNKAEDMSFMFTQHMNMFVADEWTDKTFLLVKNNGTLTYMDAEGEDVELAVKGKTLYIFENKESGMVMSNYSGSALRQLITGGTV